MEEVIRQEMLERVAYELEEIGDEQYIDDWFPFDADWDINIYREEGHTVAYAYRVKQGMVDTRDGVLLFETEEV